VLLQVQSPLNLGLRKAEGGVVAGTRLDLDQVRKVAVQNEEVVAQRVVTQSVAEDVIAIARAPRGLSR
jgi:hypothetical protein